jgi:hypothetical protein
VIDLVASLAGSSGKGLEIIYRRSDSGADPRQFARQVVDTCETYWSSRWKLANSLNSHLRCALYGRTRRPLQLEPVGQYDPAFTMQPLSLKPIGTPALA